MPKLETDSVRGITVEADYSVVFLAAGGRHHPGWPWIWKAYRTLRRKYRKNLKKLVSLVSRNGSSGAVDFSRPPVGYYMLHYGGDVKIAFRDCIFQLPVGAVGHGSCGGSTCSPFTLLTAR
jgi:hypothetical protein